MSLLWVILQVILAFIAVYVLYRIALRVLFVDRLISNDETLVSYSVKTRLTAGYIDIARVVNTQFNTTNQTFDNYQYVPFAVNHKGGAQFSYSFWLYVDEPYSAVTSGGEDTLTLFLRGSNLDYPLGSTGAKANVWCPRVYLKASASPNYAPNTGEGGRVQLGVSYNTLDTKSNDATLPTVSDFVVNTIRNPDNTMRHNLLSLIPRSWTLVTVVMMDNMPLNDFENGIMVKVYINDLLYDTNSQPGMMLRQNRGNIIIGPRQSTGSGAVKIGDLTYYNYAVPDTEVRDMYQRGPTDKAYDPSKVYRANVLRLTEVNKMDIYNV